jgi:hypothetical protein
MQFIEDLESLTHELSGLYSATGERTRTAASSHLRPSTPSNQIPRIPPGVRYEQDTRSMPRRGNEGTKLVDAQQSSGATTEALPTRRSRSSIEGENPESLVSPRERRSRSIPEALVSPGERRSRAIPEPQISSAEHRGRPSMADAKMFLDEKGQGNLVPPTAARKNITTRRSRGWKEEPSRNPHALAMKRPKG